MLMNETAFPFQRAMHRCFFVSVCSKYRQMCHLVRRKIISCLTEVQKSEEVFMKKLNDSWNHLGDYFQRCEEAHNLSPFTNARVEKEGGCKVQCGSYRAQILILHLLEFGVCVASTQLHISQHHLEHSVVNGLGKVHVKLVHSRLKREKGQRKRE